MKYAFFLVGLLLMIGACTKKISNQHSSMNSLDWQGTYSGVLFLDKAEVESVLTLKDDLSYELVLNGVRSTGDFVWSPDGERIKILQNSRLFELFVGESFLKMVGKNDQYTLQKRDDMTITEKYWKLVELNGHPVVVKEGMREPHLILKADHLVKGHGGCNSLFGEYELDEKIKRIHFSKMGGTLMACLNAGIEDEFFKTLSSVDNFSTDGDNLSLNKARMAPLARFKVVYLK